MSTGDLIHVVSNEQISANRKQLGRILIYGSFLVLLVVLALQALDALGVVALGFADWQPTAVAYVAWCVCLCVGQVLIRGETGKRILFVLPSALFDAPGVLRAIRMVTDPRPDYRRDVTEADTRKRAEAYKFGGVMAARFDIDAARDCRSSPAAGGESPVGGLFVKLDCDKLDADQKRRFILTVRMLRKPGQTDRDPRNPGQLTVGQFDSWAMLEVRRTQ